jgi:hypothetical protein
MKHCPQITGVMFHKEGFATKFLCKTITSQLKRRNHMLVALNIRIKSVYNNNGSDGEAKFPVYNSQTEGVKFMPIMFKCVSQIASAMIASGVKEGIATGRLTTEPYESPSGKKRTRTVLVIEKFNALDNVVEAKPFQASHTSPEDVEAIKSQLVANKAATSPSRAAKATKTSKTSKTSKASTNKKVASVTPSIALTYPVDNSGDDIPF